jgi:hypothetical protein
MITFPQSPSLNQEFIATNAVTYIWTGNRWDSIAAIRENSQYVYEGGDSTSLFNSPGDELIDGGDSQGLTHDVFSNLSLTETGYGYLTFNYTLKGVSGQGYSGQGIIIGTTELGYAGAGEQCSGTNSTNGATRFPMRTDLTEYEDCSFDELTVITDGSFTQNAYTYDYQNQIVNVVAYVIYNGVAYYSDAQSVYVNYVPCFAAGTQVTLADGSKKAIEHITYEDDLRVWDFDQGMVSSSKPCWIKRPQIATMFNRAKLSDGTVLDTMQYIKGHRVYNQTKNQFTFIKDCVKGDVIVKDNGHTTTFDSWEVVKGSITYYNVISDHHMNIYANDVLTSTGFNNLYPMQDMMYVKDERKPKMFAGKIPEYFVQGLRLAENITEDVTGMIKHLTHLDKLKLR